MEVDVLQGLKAARALIAEPERWTQNAMARTEIGKSVPSIHPDAACWCALGACSKVSADSISTMDLAIKVGAAVGQGLSRFNDTHTHAEVLAAFDAAIAQAERDGAR